MQSSVRYDLVNSEIRKHDSEHLVNNQPTHFEGGGGQTPLTTKNPGGNSDLHFFKIPKCKTFSVSLVGHNCLASEQTMISRKPRD